ncbi:MAG: PD-(D/E)XK nuclease family protein [Clostridiales bacterium]|nr:PD-(D/E)XK nuclease family protein [Clostridiales bacterium]
MSLPISWMAGFCAEHKLNIKYLIVPSYQVGRQIGEATAMADGAWANLHFVTLPSLAQEVAAGELSKRELKLLSQPNALFLVDRVFRRLRDGKRLKYFAKVEATTGILRALRQSLLAIRMAGLESADLDPSFFISAGKGEEMALILRGYEEELSQEKRLDLPGLYRIAIKEARKWRERKPRHRDREYYLYLEDRPLNYLEREFLTALAGDDLVLVPQDPVFGLERPRRFGALAPDVVATPRASTTPPAVGPSAAPPPSSLRAPSASPMPIAPLAASVPPLPPVQEPKSDAERLAWLFSPADAPPPLRDDTVELFSAIGPANKCREILRRVVSGKIPLDSVEIIHPAGPTYLSLLYTLSMKAGLSLTFADGIPLSFTTPGKVFNGLVEWLEDDYLVSDLCALIEAGAIKLPPGNGEAALTPLKASRYLKSAMIGWGRERYVPKLEALIEDIEARAEADAGADDVEGEGEKRGKKEDRKERAAQQVREVKSLIALVKDFLELVPEENESGTVDFGALCLGVGRFIARFTHLYGELDGEARSLLEAKLEEAAAFKTPPLCWRAALEWIKDVGNSLRVGASGPAPGHIHVSSWAEGGRSGRPRTFVVGLDQGAFPGAGIQDPILLDEERERLNAFLKTPALRTTHDSLRENLWAMARMLAGLRGHVTLSFSAYDIIEERQSFPSSVILQAARLVTGNADLDYSALGAVLPVARAFLPGEVGQAVDETDWWLGKLAPGGRLRDGLEAVKSNFVLLSRGIFARGRREKKLVTEFEGRVRIDPREVHPLHNPDILMSASRLELLARCPFAYFLKYILEVEPPAELELDQTRWLDALERGSLLHEVYARFMREVRKRREKVRETKHRPLIHAIADEVIERYKEEIPPPSESIFEQERKELHETLDVFLAAEEEWEGGGEPLFFEVTFGRKGYGEDSEIGMEEPARLELGGGRSIPLAGRIDRIDRVGAGRYRVIDYKTGSFSYFEGLRMFGNGRILQHALYAIAAEQVLQKLSIDARPVVVESGYYFPTRRGEGNKILCEIDRRKFGELVAKIISILEKGHFVVNPLGPGTDCEYCDYSLICGGTAARERAKKKKDDNSSIFDIFNRLKNYE